MAVLSRVARNLYSAAWVTFTLILGGISGLQDRARRREKCVIFVEKETMPKCSKSAVVIKIKLHHTFALLLLREIAIEDTLPVSENFITVADYNIVSINRRASGSELTLFLIQNATFCRELSYIL
jgi:hypothetical protein